ncbi:D-serine ammonia-lyase [Pseudalkalibacillus decolorationis]|uniref:D-serine ammonia-lyase n=1 Tax=Pseudalkalibacillus decolorationis TaxID=163879 RepID=UPI0021487A9A|nr:D-serine ammonia-lyase [Pseudalkalibacillus decolorationis]
MTEPHILGKPLAEWTTKFPLLNQLMNFEPVFWVNPEQKRFNDLPPLSISWKDILNAADRWERFSPFLAITFPETQGTDGIIESPLRKIPDMASAIEGHYSKNFSGDLYLKCDNDLPITGSIKARGGIYEVLKYAETLAMKKGLLTEDDDYKKFAEPGFREFFSQYSIGVGSTGNLALSIGTISAKLGFSVSVHMSADAKQWKKDLLRSKGVNVFEYKGDFSEAISEGRQLTIEDPKGYFVDDESSKDLFLGYSVAALRLKNQLDEDGVVVDKDHPLFVYLPCGVGGSPGGITFGLKHIFNDNVHCFFVEPTHSPSVLIGLLTGEHDKVAVQDFGIDNKTEADGLAVGRPSNFATNISQHLISGIYTIEDDELFKLLTLLTNSENIQVEPSATSGLLGPVKLNQSDYLKEQNLVDNMDQSTHIVWSTGGSLVPQSDMNQFYQKGQNLLDQ